MDDARAEEIALKAMRLHIARLESEGDKPLNLAAAIELCDQIRNLRNEGRRLPVERRREPCSRAWRNGRNRGWATCSVAISKTPPSTSPLTD